jgi:hypothetical protein
VRRVASRAGAPSPRLALALLAAAARAGAQASDPPPAGGAWEVVPFFARGQHSPAGRSWGLTPDRNHWLIGAQFATPVLRAGPVTLAYAPNVVPLFVLSNNPRYGTVVVNTPRGPVSARAETGRGPVYGYAVMPFGLRLSARVRPGLDAFAAGGVGGVRFARDVPVEGARRANVTLEWGGGVVARAGARRRVLAGYKFHHLSNAYSAGRNPGVDADLFYAGLGWLLRAPR